MLCTQIASDKQVHYIYSKASEPFEYVQNKVTEFEIIPMG